MDTIFAFSFKPTLAGCTAEDNICLEMDIGVDSKGRADTTEEDSMLEENVDSKIRAGVCTEILVSDNRVEGGGSMHLWGEFNFTVN